MLQDTLIVLCFCLITIVYIRLKLKHTYWQCHSLPYIKSHYLLGNLKDLLFLRVSFGELFRSLYAKSNIENAPVVGIYVFQTPALIIRDPDLIKLILIKNCNMFLNRYEAADPRYDMLGAFTLPLAKYAVWRESRKKLCELFTSGMLKDRMFPLMLRIASDLEKYVQQRVDTQVESTTIEVKELCALFTTDLTAILSFSVKANSLRCGTSAMRQQCQNLLKPNIRKALHFFAVFFLPKLTTYIRAKVFSSEYVKFMRKLVTDIRDKRTQEKSCNGDLIDILIQMQNEYSAVEGHFVHHDDFICAQAAIFMLVGFETSSSAIAFTLYELAKQPEIPSKLRAEIKFNLEQANVAEFSYERLTNMIYLNMVVAEALRMYPAASFINRECTMRTKEYGYSLKPFVDFIIPNGMPAYISILGLHRDSKYWPNPNHFDPQRFTFEKLNSIEPMTYIPFGAGPHGCIGSRLGLLQVKLGLVYILKNYKLETCARTIPEITFDAKSFMLQSADGIYLNFIKDKLID